MEAGAGARVVGVPGRPGGGRGRLPPGARWAAREALLAPAGCSPAALVERGGRVSLVPGADGGGALAALGECGDPRCGCNRLTRPHSRHAFEGVVARMAAAAFDQHLLGRGRPLVYASLGAGLLLQDLILLERLLLSGFRFSTVILCDPQYSALVAAEAAAPGSLWDPVQGPAHTPEHARVVRAVLAFAEWFAGDFSVLITASFQDYHAACSRDPRAFCSDLLMQIDAACPEGPFSQMTFLNTDPERPADRVEGSLIGDFFHARDVKGCVLQPYGLFASLSNLGALGSAAEETGRPSDFKDSWVCVEQKVPSGAPGALRDFFPGGGRFVMGSVVCDPGGNASRGLNPRNPREIQSKQEAQRRQARRLGLRVFRVVGAPKVVVRNHPDLHEGRVVGLRRLGEEVVVQGEAAGWVRLWGREEWMLVDGGAKGLGTLLAEVPLGKLSGRVLAELNSQRDRWA